MAEYAPRRNALLPSSPFNKQEVPSNRLLDLIRSQSAGSQSLEPSMTNQRGAFDPLVGWWNGQPVTQSQADALPVNPFTGKLGEGGRMAAEAVMGATTAPSVIGGKLASKLNFLYNPPNKTQRPITEDYKNGWVTDDAGKPLFDPEGRTLTAPFIAGRSRAGVGGGGDEAIPAAQFDAITEAITGNRAAPQTKREMRGDAGSLEKFPLPDGSGTGYQVYFDKTLKPAAIPGIVAHETSHAIDEIAGQIPVEGLTKELRPLYNLLATGQDRATKLTLPQHFGYSGENIPRELMAEAIRGYMTNPNYLKTVAPQTAARIREYVNNNPRLKSVIQFNSAVGGLGFAAAGNGGDEQ